MTAGYSKRPLADKLGIKPDMKAAIIAAPEGYFDLLSPLPAPIDLYSEIRSECDFIHFFTKERSELATRFPRLKRAMNIDGMLWISWPKRASKVPTTLTEDVIRQIGLDHGLVDIKVCAVDEVWSGLKFVYRSKDRIKGN